MAEDFTPLFTGGSGRSGTTIVLNMLKYHPEIHASLPREIKYLTSRFGLIDLNFGRALSLEEGYRGLRNNLAARLYPLVGKKKEKVFLNNLQNSWWSETGKKGKPRGLVQGITKEQLLTACDRFDEDFTIHPIEASQKLFFELSSSQINQPGIRYFADSTPVNMMQADYIYRLFPHAKFMNMVRDGRDVALSVSKEKWGPNDAYEALDWWSNRVLVASRALSHLPEHQKMDMRLENLITLNREHEYSRILDFLQIADAPLMRDYFNTQVQGEKMSQGLWKNQVKDPESFDRKYDKLLEKLASEGVTVTKLY